MFIKYRISVVLAVFVVTVVLNAAAFTMAEVVLVES